MENKKQGFATFVATLGYFIFGLSLLFSKSALSMTTPFALLAFRFVIAFIILNIMRFFKPFKLDLKGKPLGLLFFLGFTQPILYFTFEIFGVDLLPTSLAGTLLAITPVFSIIVGVLLLKEKSSFLILFFACISVVGVFLTTINRDGGSFSLLGILFLLLAVLSAVIFNLISKKICNKFTPFERTYVMFLLGSVFFTALSLLTSQGQYYEVFILPLKNARFWLDIVYLGAISSVCAFFFINYAMTYLPISRVSIFNNLTAVVSILAGVIFLKEPFGFFQITGSIIVLASVFIAGVLGNKLRNTTLQNTLQEKDV